MKEKKEPQYYVVMLFLFALSLFLSWVAWHGGFILSDMLNQLIDTNLNQEVSGYVTAIVTFCTLMYIGIKEL